MGKGSATAWGCDLSDQYVRINADYTTQPETDCYERDLGLLDLGATVMLPLNTHIVVSIQGDRSAFFLDS